MRELKKCGSVSPAGLKITYKGTATNVDPATCSDLGLDGVTLSGAEG